MNRSPILYLPRHPASWGYGCKHSAMLARRTAPSRMIFHCGSVISTVVAPGPLIAPPSRTKSTRPSIVPKTSIPLRQVGFPDRLALVAMIGISRRSIKRLETVALAQRTASRPVFPVTLSGNFEAAGNDDCQRPGPKMAGQQVKTRGQGRGVVLRHLERIHQDGK